MEPVSGVGLCALIECLHFYLFSQFSESDVCVPFLPWDFLGFGTVVLLELLVLAREPVLIFQFVIHFLFAYRDSTIRGRAAGHHVSRVFRMHAPVPYECGLRGVGETRWRWGCWLAPLLGRMLPLRCGCTCPYLSFGCAPSFHRCWLFRCALPGFAVMCHV